MKITLFCLLVSLSTFLSAQDIFKEKYYQKDNVFYHLKSKDTLVYYKIGHVNNHFYSLDYFKDTTFLNYLSNKQYQGKYANIKIENQELFLNVSKSKDRFIKVQQIDTFRANKLLNNYFLDEKLLSVYYNKDSIYVHYDYFSDYRFFLDSIELSKPNIEFKENVNQKFSRINDSIQKINNKIIAFSKSLQKNIESDNYSRYKDSLFILLSDYMSVICFNEKINYIIQNNPERYLQLISEYPNFKNDLLTSYFYSRKNKKKIKSVENFKIAKKTYLKDRRRTIRNNVLVFTGITSIYAVIWGGIIYLIVR